MQITTIPEKDGGHVLGLEFFYDEIDQLLNFASAVRIFRPDWLNSAVSVEGTDPKTKKFFSYKNCSLISAFSWGYLRTLIAHDGNDKEITIGGGNAIMEDLA